MLLTSALMVVTINLTYSCFVQKTPGNFPSHEVQGMRLMVTLHCIGMLSTAAMEASINFVAFGLCVSVLAI